MTSGERSDAPATIPPGSAPPTKRRLTFTEALQDALDVALGLDGRVFLLGSASDPTRPRTATTALAAKYGTSRVREAASSERVVLDAAVGAALAGMRPVLEIGVVDQAAACLDLLSAHAARIRYTSGGQSSVPLVVRIATGPADPGDTVGARSLEAWAVHVPGLKVVVPSSPADAKGLLLASIFDPDPVLFVEQTAPLTSSAVVGAVPEGDVRVPLGRAAVKRKGKDVSLFTYGRQVADALEVAGRLAADDIDVEVVDLRTLVPLDEETVFASVGKTKNALVLHEAVTRGGFGAELASRIHEELFADLEHPVARVGAANTPIPFARELLSAYLPSQDRLAAALRSLTT